MHILIAPNAFKHSLDAEAVALAIEAGLQQSRLSCTTECFAIADGGDGTGHLIRKKCGAMEVTSLVKGPLGEPLKAAYGFIETGKTAVIEMASASGLRLLKPEQLNPARALSYGTGEQVRHALDNGAKKIIIAMGGSAMVDGGTGILSALGVRFLDKEGTPLQYLPENLPSLDTIDLSAIDRRIYDCEVVVLCDVDNRLLGAAGAAAVFGPQKGATPEQVSMLDNGLSRLSEVALRTTGKAMSSIRYGGTAGGAAAGLYALIGATLANGIDYFLDLTGFDHALERSDLVITGEGNIDEQTLQGKGPFGVARRAKQRDIPVIGLAGGVPLTRPESMAPYFDVLMPIGNAPAALPAAFRDAGANLTRAAREIGNLLALGK